MGPKYKFHSIQNMTKKNSIFKLNLRYSIFCEPEVNNK